MRKSASSRVFYGLTLRVLRWRAQERERLSSFSPASHLASNEPSWSRWRNSPTEWGMTVSTKLLPPQEVFPNGLAISEGKAPSDVVCIFEHHFAPG